MAVGLRHREFVAHRREVHHDGYSRHSHCPNCGNTVGEATRACAACGETFDPSP